MELIRKLPEGDEASVHQERPLEEEEAASKSQNESAKKRIKERQKKKRRCIRHVGTDCGFPSKDINAIIDNLSHDQQAALATRLTDTEQQHWFYVFDEERKGLAKDGAPT